MQSTAAQVTHGFLVFVQWVLGVFAIVFSLGACIPPYARQNAHWFMFALALYGGWTLITAYRAVRENR